MGARQTILVVDAGGALTARLATVMPDRKIVRSTRTGAEVLAVITSLRFDAIVLYHPAPRILESLLLPEAAKLADPPRMLVIAEHDDCTAISARYGVTCVREPVGVDAIAAAIDLVCERDLRVARP
jgi:hypothetical protein